MGAATAATPAVFKKSRRSSERKPDPQSGHSRRWSAMGDSFAINGGQGRDGHPELDTPGGGFATFFFGVRRLVVAFVFPAAPANQLRSIQRGSSAGYNLEAIDSQPGAPYDSSPWRDRQGT